MLRLCLLLLPFSLIAHAADWSQVPKLPHKLVKDWPQLPTGWSFVECAGVAVDRYDRVWVFHRGPRPVMAFSKNGKLLQAWEETPIVSAHGIAADLEGNVWLADVGGHSVMKLSPRGRLLMVIANAGRSPGDNNSKYAFNRPTGLAFQPGGGFYVSDGYGNSRVIAFSAKGEYVRHWGEKGTGDGEFDLVHDVAVDHQGRVYVADRSNSRVQVFDDQGRFLAKWTDVGQPWGLAYYEPENVLYMADGQANRVVKLNTEGQVLGQLGEFGKAPGQFDFAHHLAVDSEGSIYVTEIKNWRVQKFARPQ